MENPKKILLTGGNGFLASRFAIFYKDRFQVILLDRHHLDVRNEEQIFSQFQIHKPDIVIHSAALANTNYCEQHPEETFLINVQGSISVAKGKF